MHRLAIRRTPSLLGIVAVVALLAPGAASSAGAAYPGNNGKIAFLGDQSPSKVVTARANGSHRKVVLRRDAYFPSFSASGRRLIFAGKKGIYVSRADGKKVMKVPHTNGPQSSPKLSPDGKTIAYIGTKVGGPDTLYTIRNDGTHKRAVTDKRNLGFDVAFSPDGRYVVTGFCAIRRIDLKTGEIKDLYNPRADEVCPKNPDISPNGKRVAFEFAYEPDNQIWTVGMDGNNPHALIKNYRLEAGDPVYSPDGKKLLFEAEQGNSGKDRLMTADAKTGKNRHLLGSFTGYAPTWGPRTK